MNIPAYPPALAFNPASRLAARTFGRPAWQANALYRLRARLRAPVTLPYLRGIDGNNWVKQNLLDPSAVAQAAPWGYWKGTEGTWWVDPSHVRALELRAAGQIQFLYHFFRRNVPGAPQAAWFHAQVGQTVAALGGHKICLVDYETTDGVTNEVGNIGFRSLATNLHAYGYKVGLYTSYWKAVEYGLNAAWVNNYVDFYLVAHYKPNNSPTLPPAWTPGKIMAQQEGVLGLHSWVKPVPGIAPQFDCNLLLWSLPQLETFTGQTAGFPPPPPPPGDEDMPTLVTCTVNNLKVRSTPTTAYGDTNKVDTLALGEVVERWFVAPDAQGNLWYAIRRINASEAERGRLGYSAYQHVELGSTKGFDTPPP